jgi:diguanylate cyclase (GGDEF)-like protein/PAS domain S-box-containing protein
MADHWLSLVANLATVALFISGWVHGQVIFAARARRWRNLAFGATMGAGAVASMALAIPLGGLLYDLRLSLIGLAAFFGGPLAALAAVVIAATYRSFLGGPAELAAIIAIGAMALVGLALARLIRGRPPSMASAVLLAIAVAVMSLIWVAVFQLGSSGSLPLLVLPVALMNAAATGICAFFIVSSAAVERERDLFRAAFAQSPDFQYVKTPDSRFAAVNLEVAEINGFPSPADMVGKTDFDLVARERAEMLMRAEQRIVQTGEPLLDDEELVLDAAGEETWYSTSKVQLRGSDGKVIGLAGATRDITSARRLRQELADSRNQLSYVLSEITDGIAMFDRQGTLVYRNEQYSSLFPLSAGVRRSGMHIRDILQAVVDLSEQKGIPHGGEAAWMDAAVAALKTTSEQEIELFDGRWLRLRTRPTSDGSAMVMVADVTKIKEAEAALLSMTTQLRLLATTDGLTGLANRRAFDQALETEIARHRRGKASLALLMIDVDHFKRYNDIYGHPAGDEVLKAIAAALRKALKRPADIAARYGGEEFIATMPDTDEAGAMFIAEGFRDRLHTLAITHSGSDSGIVTVSVGVAVFTSMDTTMTGIELVRRADEALYSAKRAGRNRVTGWRPQIAIAPLRKALP